MFDIVLYVIVIGIFFLFIISGISVDKREKKIEVGVHQNNSCKVKGDLS